jgi:lipid-binding SYLF domain-containing protein
VITRNEAKIGEFKREVFRLGGSETLKAGNVGRAVIAAAACSARAARQRSSAPGRQSLS